VYTNDRYYNGCVGPNGLMYFVRDSYFEPSLGHTHQGVIESLLSKSYLGRPALVEIHRMNFIGPQRSADQACHELGRLLAAACQRFRDLRFMSTAELAAHCVAPSDLVETRGAPRAHLALRRLAGHSRLRKLAWITGAIVPAWLAYLITRSQPFVETPE
jgi:hypothetical protein